MASHVVASVDEIPPGERKIVDVAGRSIGVFNIGGEFFAIRNRCPHQGGPLCLGPLVGSLESTAPGEYVFSRPGELVRCPWHAWEFDLRTGESWFDPLKMRVRSYDVSLSQSDEPTPGDATAGSLVRGPYEVETYPARTDRRLVVIDVDD